jgi:hypothetical protein
MKNQRPKTMHTTAHDAGCCLKIIGAIAVLFALFCLFGCGDLTGYDTSEDNRIVITRRDGDGNIEYTDASTGDVLPWDHPWVLSNAPHATPTPEPENP